MTSHGGSCHCGGVKFRLTVDPVELTTCDCSLCIKKNALMTRVHESELEILAGAELLSLYEWNTRRAKHFFCSRCGIYVFHRKRAMPDHFGVNIFCLDDFDPATLPRRATEGANMTIADPAPHPRWPGPREPATAVD